MSGMRRHVRRIHFVGIGGVGMSGIAELLQAQGYRVSGSDQRESPTLERLRAAGVAATVGHDADAVGDADVVVYSSAIRATNPELLAAGQRNIPVIPRAEMLAELMRLKDGIAVAGTHGKTTTTSMIGHVLTTAGLDPTVVVGGRVLTGEAAGGARLGDGAWLVAEADESDGSFLRLAPVVAVITNIDPEHLDHYGSTEALDQAFADFANRIPFWGAAVVCIDHPGVQRILPQLGRRTLSYGFTPQAEWRAAGLENEGFATRFSVSRAGERMGDVRIALPGVHNAANALAALAVACELDVPFASARDALAGFRGVERRFEQKGRAGGVLVVDDYGHHPAEVRATLAAARAAHSGPITAIFQPHRYTRTRDLFEDFATAFHDADRVVVTEVYAAGEDKIAGAEGSRLAEAIRARGHRDVHFIAELEEITRTLPASLKKGELVLTLGAGNVSSLCEPLLEALRGRGKEASP